LIDCGTEGEFIDEKFIHQNSIRMHKLKALIPVRNIDGTLKKARRISQYCDLSFSIKEISMQKCFFVTSLGEDAILGMTWLKKENSDINWTNQEVHLRE
ncbi:hypothetical protein BDR04DRAFT_955695, partial [Suillus decipiens]